MHSTRRSAFTLIELLVVIAIVGLLAALLLPAVQAARETANLAVCNNRMKEIARANVMHATSRGRFAGHTENFYGQPVPWPVVILPNLQQQNIYNDWRQGNSSLTPKLAEFLCPSDPEIDSDTTNRISFVGNAGLSGVENKANGFFLAITTNQKVTPVDIKDGAANTILISENSQGGHWHVPGKIPGDTVFVYYVADPSALDINVDGDNPAPIPSEYHRRPSSYHRGNGVNVAFADEHTHFIAADKITYSVYQALMTLDNRKATPANLPPLQDGSF